MASKDKALGRVSDWTTLAMMAGLTMLPLLPAQKIAPARTAAPPRVAAAPSVAPAPAPPAATAPAPPASAAAAEQPKTTDQPADGAAAPPPEPDAWTEAQQTEELRECLRVLAPVVAEIQLDEPIKKGQCGTPAPVLLHSIGSSAKVSFSPAPMMNCRLAAQMARWVDAVLQPAAREVLGSRITRIVGASSYSCRNIYNKPDLPLSQHATGAAVDIAGFVTEDGRTITVAKAWGPTERDIVAAQKKAAEVAKAAEKKKDAKAAKEDTASGETDGTNKKDSEDAKVHKAGFKTDERAKPAAPPAVTLTAAKTSESAFLKRLHSGACTVFGTVLGPEANEAHRDHFHFDVKERKRRGVCH